MRLLLLLLSLALAAPAATIVASSPGGSITAVSPMIGHRSALAFSWTQSSAYDLVSIQAVVGEIAETGAGTAYLMRSLGPGATAADQIAAAAVDFPFAPGGNPPGDTVLFTGLSLGPGTYSVVLLTPFSNASSGAYWFTGNGLTTGNGVTFDGNFTSIVNNIAPYAPASDFVPLPFESNLLFSVSGREAASPAPEPSALVLMAGGVALIAIRRARNS